MLRVNMIYMMFFLLLTGCNGQEAELEKYVEIKSDTILVKAPFKILSHLPFENSEPYVICLREQFAYRFGSLDMHLEHSNARKLYSNVLEIPMVKLLEYDDEAFRREVETFYFVDEVSDLEEKKEDIYEATLVQKIDNEKSKSIVECKKRNFRYLFEKANGNWVIVDIGPIE